MIVRVIFFAVCLSQAYSLYEDQIGKFDWRQEYLGKVESVVFENSRSISKHIFVATGQNVVACISAKSGEIVWRKVVSESDGKVVRLFHVNKGVLAITDTGLARVWDVTSGIMECESNLATDGFEMNNVIDVTVVSGRYSKSDSIFALTPQGIVSSGICTYQAPNTVIFSQNLIGDENDDSYEKNNHQEVISDTSEEKFIHLDYHLGSVLRARTYQSSKLEILSDLTVDIAWLDDIAMAVVLEEMNLVYAGRDEYFHVVSLKDGIEKLAVSFEELEISQPIRSLIANDRKDASARSYDFIVLHGEDKISHIHLHNEDEEMSLTNKWTEQKPGTSSVSIKQVGTEFYVFISSASSTKKLSTVAIDLKTGDKKKDLTVTYKSPAGVGAVDQVYINMYLKKTTPIGFRVMVRSADHSIAMISSPNHEVWRRDESLSDICDVIMMDLPLSDMTDELESKTANNLAQAFVKRVDAQVLQFSKFIWDSVQELNDGTFFKKHTKDPLIQIESLTRDPFSLHKMIVAATRSGALFGIDSLNGDIVWRYFHDGLHDMNIKLYLQRTAAHSDPLVALLATKAGKTTVLLHVDPITGRVQDKSDEIATNSRIIQAAVLPTANDHFVKPLVLLDADLKLHVVPAGSDIDSFYMCDADKSNGLLRGFQISSDLSVQQVWSMAIPKAHQMLFAMGKPFNEKVNSLGRPLADRSVIYKYLNPNAVAIVSESVDQTADRSSIMLHIIDVVTGKILHSTIHRKAAGPVHMVHSENWLVYSYWSTKARRTEISSIELYEGSEQYNTTVFSSFQERPLPNVVQQSYIFSAGITSMGVSRTERGITSRQILFGLKKGNLFGLFRRFFDPRRPLQMEPKHREEGLIAYAPELPIAPELILSYNLTVEGIKNIYTAPAALESTSVVFITGLDLFFTRTQPSKMFDVLKDDFDHMFILVVLFIMFIVALVTRRLAQVKQLKKAWK